MQQELAEAKKSAETFESLYKSSLVDNQSAKQKIQDLEEEINKLHSRLKNVQDSLDQGTLALVKIQNQNQTLREELAFKMNRYNEEIRALTIKHTGLDTVHRDGVKETDDDFAERLQAAIDEAREEIEKETQQFKLDLEESYKIRLESLESQSQHDASARVCFDDELKNCHTTLAKNNRDIEKLQEKNEQLESALREKSKELTQTKQLHSAEIARLMDEMRALRANYDRKMKEYEEWLDLRMQLEQEIATLSALLQEEEQRLSLQTTPREKRPRVARDGEGPRSKRKKQVGATSSNAVGFMQIIDVDPDGRFVQIKNTSDKIEHLGGFKIIHEVENTGEKVEFRFHSKSKLLGGAAVTIWAAGIDGAVHSPPSDIIWKAVNNWGFGSRTSTSLCTKNGEVVATFSQHREESFMEVAGNTPLPPPSLEVAETDVGIQTFPSIPPTAPVRVSPTSTSHAACEQEEIFYQQDDPPPPPIEEPPPKDCIIS
ncbi:PREDICTED: lamin-A-like isoform X2 [Amphimedon queenslandica]|nr:PREDICTED: lamin-A-like isoform X2 [Amphimedon queenslandica]|eukprot:XP_019855325.1 PREDICTED: lamin-A-like isoform X2 [Amphimedon queenslandica]